jgi:hypothetical protein
MYTTKVLSVCVHSVAVKRRLERHFCSMVTEIRNFHSGGSTTNCGRTVDSQRNLWIERPLSAEIVLVSLLSDRQQDFDAKKIKYSITCAVGCPRADQVRSI